MLPPLTTMLRATLAVVFAAAAVPAASATMLNGSGTISVLVGSNGTTDPSTTTPSDSVGCINAVGKVTLGDCATFNAHNYHISSDAGFCSFQNTSQPANTDDLYGKSDYAFHCWNHSSVASDTQFYTISGLPYEFLGQGDMDLFYDIPSLPEANENGINMWYFVWGDSQPDVPSGHSKALLLWEPVTTS